MRFPVKFFITFLLGFSSISAQFDSLYLQDNLNIILEESDSEIEDEELYEYLDQLRDDPVDLNKASVNDLLKIPFLDFSSASEIINYRNEEGNFSEKNILYKIKNIPSEIIDRIFPFVIVKENRFKKAFSSMNGELRSRIINDVQTRDGFEKEKFLGDRYKTYNRMKLEFGDKVNINLLAEKDAGENSYFDFTSFSFAIEEFYFLNKFVAGDYLAEFGQGLILWSPYGFGKNSSSIASVTKSERRFIPYSSSDENRFFRGGAIKTSYGNLSFSAFYSEKKIDARIDTISGNINSIPIDGYHRTDSELFKKNKLSEKIAGLTSTFSLFQNANLSLLYLNESLGESQQRNNEYYSFAYSLFIKDLMIKGETATEGNNFSSIVNAAFKINKNVSLLTSYRNYSGKFLSRFANALSEGSNPNNETGFYTGLDLRTKLGRSIIYYDIFKFPASSFYSDFPSTGNELSVYHEFIPVKRTKVRLNLKIENKEKQSVFDNRIITSARKIVKYKIDFTNQLSKSLRLKSRIEFSDFKDVTVDESGLLLYQDLHAKYSKSISIYGRIIFFKTDSYNSRVYEFENDLTGTMYNPALFGEGIRWYSMVKYRPAKNLILSGKYSETYKPDERIMGSGLMRINNNLDNRVSFQLDVYF